MDKRLLCVARKIDIGVKQPAKEEFELGERKRIRDSKAKERHLSKGQVAGKKNDMIGEQRTSKIEESSPPCQEVY